MKIFLHLNWHKKGQNARKAFKLSAAYELVAEYESRIRHFAEIEILGAIKPQDLSRKNHVVWFCDRGAGAKILSSEDIAAQLERVADSGVQELRIVIGGADGFSKNDFDDLKPRLRWSFGSMTLPHELAAVIAMEQIYRGWSILKNLPYHQGH